MKRILTILALTAATLTATAQFKPRPDAFPPAEEPLASKAVTMASTVAEMADWNRYPTYETYLAMMQQWAENYPTLCHVDTIGTSVQGRLILSMYIEIQTDDDLYRPEFFYSSTIHGDEVTGYVMMLHLIDTLLTSYGTSPELTALVNSTRISINPLANPDGTYHGGNQTVQGSQRYNANGVDLNRNYPDPFGSTKAALQQENEFMIAYVSEHHFKLSANLHGGSEVMNYPWDCFTSAQFPHPAADWWREVCHRFVDTARVYNNSHFRDVYQADNGVIAGGDWYVIHGGRQDYMNYYHNCLELTMELSSQKTLSSNRLPEYWHFLAKPLINYIGEIHSLPEIVGIAERPEEGAACRAYPNPTTGVVTVSGLTPGESLYLYDMNGCLADTYRADGETLKIDLKKHSQGTYLLRTKYRTIKLSLER